MSAPPHAPERYPKWLSSAALFGLLCAVALLFFRGSLLTSDEVIMGTTARQLAMGTGLTFEEPLFGQEASKYGIGTPLLAVPFAWAEARFLSEELWLGGSTLLPLLNVILFALAGVVVALALTGPRRWFAAAIALVSSPLLAASATFFSEPLAGLATLTLAVFLIARPWPEERERLILLLLIATGALALLARMSMLPVLLLILIAAWRFGAGARRLVAGAAGIGLGLLVTMLINRVLRGDFFATGYEGEAFTSPLTTGVYGLLFSSERGALLFFPLLLAPLLGWRLLDERIKQLTLVAAVGFGFSVIFHGVFWTWHGGWTQGPRFLLPVLLLFLPGIAQVLMRATTLPTVGQNLLLLALGWSLLLSYIYASRSAFLWWNQLWGFHQEENQWLFFPQLSLWAAWLEGVPLRRGAAPIRELLIPWIKMIAFSLAALCIYPLVVNWRGQTGMEQRRRAGSFGELFRQIPASSPILWAIIALWIAAVLSLLGPRTGWERAGDERRSRFLFVEGAPGVYSGWLRKPVDGPITLAARANALYEVRVNGEVILQQLEPIPQHLPRVTLDLPVGSHFVEIFVQAKGLQEPAIFQLYATWPGGGRYLQPLGGRWITERPPTGFGALILWIQDRFWILFALALALQLLLLYRPTPESGEIREDDRSLAAG